MRVGRSTIQTERQAEDGASSSTCTRLVVLKECLLVWKKKCVTICSFKHVLSYLCINQMEKWNVSNMLWSKSLRIEHSNVLETPVSQPCSRWAVSVPPPLNANELQRAPPKDVFAPPTSPCLQKT